VNQLEIFIQEFLIILEYGIDFTLDCSGRIGVALDAYLNDLSIDEIINIISESEKKTAPSAVAAATERESRHELTASW